MKNRKYALIIIVILLISISVGTKLFLIKLENAKHEIDNYQSKSDSINIGFLNRNNELIEMLNLKQSTIDSLISHINGNTNNNLYGITINDKSITIEELIRIANKRNEQNRKLRRKLHYDSIKIDGYENLLNKLEEEKLIIQDSGLIKYNNPETIDAEYNTIIDSLYSSLNSLNTENQKRELKIKVYEEKYGIKLEAKERGDSIIVVYPVNTKVDSALWLFPHYKHKIKTNRKGETVIK